MENLSAEIRALSSILYRTFKQSEIIESVHDVCFINEEPFKYFENKTASIIKQINDNGLIEIDFSTRDIIIYKGFPIREALSKNTYETLVIGECKMKNENGKVAYENLNYTWGSWDPHVKEMFKTILEKVRYNKTEQLKSFESIFE